MLKILKKPINPSLLQHPLGYLEASFEQHGRLNRNLRIAGLEVDDLRGKKILDIGSGHDNFGQEARKLGLDVVSIDPDYHIPEAKWRLRTHYGGSGFHVSEGTTAFAAVAENLPFNKGCFDLIIAIRSLPEYSVTSKSPLRAIEEMHRVVKRNGQLRIFPFIIDPSIALNIRGRKRQVYEQAFSRFERFNRPNLRKVLNKD